MTLSKPGGQLPHVMLPCLKQPTTVAVSNAAVFITGGMGWQTLTYSTWHWGGNLLALYFAEDYSLIDNGEIKLCRMNLTVS